MVVPRVADARTRVLASIFRARVVGVKFPDRHMHATVAITPAARRPPVVAAVTCTSNGIRIRIKNRIRHSESPQERAFLQLPKIETRDFYSFQMFSGNPRSMIVPNIHRRRITSLAITLGKSDPIVSDDNLHTEVEVRPDRP